MKKLFIVLILLNQLLIIDKLIQISTPKLRKYGVEEKETQFIRKNYKNLSQEEIARKLGRSHHGIQRIMKDLNLGVRKQKNFNRREDRFILTNWKKMTRAEIARRLKRSPSSIRSRYLILKTKVNKRRK